MPLKKGKKITLPKSHIKADLKEEEIIMGEKKLKDKDNMKKKGGAKKGKSKDCSY